ncbi:MAG: N(4)-(beta-N-acetylglucosaminyl)-L-asparaginase [Planctomycetes bacterium]|nr:N(4)-(beta-N-acetylglucosaminyl)-L-asparaginase [Planctomycetota bacterium]
MNENSKSKSTPESAANDASSAESATGPVVLSTWNFGLAANARALSLLDSGGSALDAAESGVMVTEADVNEHTVGLAGYPDRDGFVTLDAAIMDERGRAGSVAFVRGVAHPISLARMVMERTPHVLLVGEGAEQFARSQGVEILPDALHPEARAAWQEWLKEKKYKPQANRENAPRRPADANPSIKGGERDHDTIAMLVRDEQGRLAAACTTSGMSWKMHGRVGDSPIIGAGLYVDGEVGGAVCTGVGEIPMRSVAAFLIVERMRFGASAQEACQEAVARMIRNTPDAGNFQVGVLALSRSGGVGAYSIQSGFTYAMGTAEGNEMRSAAHAF